MNKLIIVNGLPATGKTTIGKYLSDSLGFAFLSKDIIKESLFDSLGARDRSWSHELGKASFGLLYLSLEELLSKMYQLLLKQISTQNMTRTSSKN